jgi:hypothetical protein
MARKPKPTEHERQLNRLTRGKLIGWVLTLGVIIVAIGKFTDALDGVARIIRAPFRRHRAALIDEYCKLLAPLTVQFDRTLDAFKRYSPKDFALEQTLEDGNTKARVLLEVNAQLIPPTLEADQHALIEHYDRWLEELRRVRKIGADSLTAFIFVGPSGTPFPRVAEQRFRARRDSIRLLLGDDRNCGTPS